MSVDELIFPDGTPATITCSKCGKQEPVTATRIERRLVSKEPLFSALVVTESVMPEKWSRVQIFERLLAFEEVLKTQIYVCGECNIEIG